RLCGERAERDDGRRSNDLQLAHQIRTARVDFDWKRVAIPGRPVLQHVDNEYVLACELDSLENFGEQLTGLADERAAGLVFTRARRLADAHETRCRAALTRHGMLGGSVEITLAAGADERLDVLYRLTVPELAVKELVSFAAHDYTIWRRTRRRTRRRR